MCQGICVFHGDGQNLVHNPNKCVSEKYPLNYDRGSSTQAVSGSKQHLLLCFAMVDVVNYCSLDCESGPQFSDSPDSPNSLIQAMCVMQFESGTFMPDSVLNLGLHIGCDC